MVSEWKPQGYNSVSVYLVADGAQRVIDFLKKTFGATDLRRLKSRAAKSCTRKYASEIRW